MEEFEKALEGIEGLRRAADQLEVSGATTHPDPAAAEFARFMKEGLNKGADEEEAKLNREIDQEADEGEKLL